MLQSPRFSVTLQSSFKWSALSSAICLAAACRNSSAEERASPGNTSRNWPPPLEPRRMRASPSSANSARGSTSAKSVTHCERPDRRSSPLALDDVGPADLDRRNSSMPRIFPCKRICSDIQTERLENTHCSTGGQADVWTQQALVADHAPQTRDRFGKVKASAKNEPHVILAVADTSIETDH